MITATSRYAASPIALLNSRRGSVVTLVPGVPAPKAFAFTYITVAEGDRLDTLASQAFGDERLWWKIADANPEIIDWTDLQVGTVLRIPSVG